LFIGFGPDVEAASRTRLAASVHLEQVSQTQTPRSLHEEAV
jgi:hypothetical protein